MPLVAATPHQEPPRRLRRQPLTCLCLSGNRHVDLGRHGAGLGTCSGFGLAYHLGRRYLCFLGWSPRAPVWPCVASVQLALRRLAVHCREERWRWYARVRLRVRSSPVGLVLCINGSDAENVTCMRRNRRTFRCGLAFWAWFRNIIQIFVAPPCMQGRSALPLVVRQVYNTYLPFSGNPKTTAPRPGGCWPLCAG